MRAVIAPEPGGPEALRTVERPDPEPGPGEVLIRVRAAGLNRADLMQRRGHYPPPEGADDVLGLELSGTVAALGPPGPGDAGVPFPELGDRVCALVASGAYAELAAVPAAQVLPAPKSLDLVEAAALPEAFATAWDNVFTRAGLRAGEALLVHGGSSGVGTALVQLARRAGARVAVTASTPEKLAACRQLGAELGVNYREEDFVDRVRAWTHGRGADVVLDMVGAAYLERNVEVLATEGRLAVIGLQEGTSATLDLARLLSRRLRIGGSTLRARSAEEKAAVVQQLRDQVWPGFSDGTLRPVVHVVHDWEDVAEAHRAMEAGGHIGKFVLRIG